MPKTRRQPTPQRRGAAAPQAAPQGSCVTRFALLAVIAVAAALAVYLFLGQNQEPRYNWDNLSWQNDRPVYTKDGKVTSMIGCDVSAYNGDFDWDAAAADGIQFAFLRIGWRGYSEGSLNTDEYCPQYYQGAKAHGIRVGVYLFSSAISADEAREEADLVLSQLSAVGASPETLEMPVVFDLETVSGTVARANYLTIAEASEIANAFCERIESAGYEAMLYGNQSDLLKYDESVTKNRRVWMAEYGVEHPTASFDFDIWQYTAYGYIAGIDRNVDLDVWILAEEK